MNNSKETDFLIDIFKKLKTFGNKHENSVIVYVAGMLDENGKPQFSTSNINGHMSDLAGMIGGLMACEEQFAKMMIMAVESYKEHQKEGGEQ